MKKITLTISIDRDGQADEIVRHIKSGFAEGESFGNSEQFCDRYVQPLIDAINIDVRHQLNKRIRGQ